MKLVFPNLLYKEKAEQFINEFIEYNNLHKEYADLGLEILYKQQYNDKISRDLILCSNCNEIIGQNNICPSCGTKTWNINAEEIPFAHKTGGITATIHDAGILKVKDRNIIIVCLTDMIRNNDEANKIHKELGKAVYKYFLNLA